MLNKLTINRLTGQIGDDSIKVVQSGEDEQNTELILRFLADNKGNSKLPIIYKNPQNERILLSNSIRSQSQGKSEPYDCGDIDSSSSPMFWNHEVKLDARSTDVDFSKPLLNSKKNLSNLLISGCYQAKRTEMVDAHLEKEEGEFKMEESFDNRESSDSPDLKKKPQQTSATKNLRLIKDARRESNKVRETDPVLIKSRPFLVEKKSFKEFQRVREGISTRQRNKKHFNELEISDNKEYNNQNEQVPEELTPIHQLLYKESSKKYHESYLYEVPMLNGKVNSNLVLDGSSSNKWRFLYHGMNIVQRFDYSRDYNYSNNDYIHAKTRTKKRLDHSNDQASNDRISNMSSEPKAIFGPDICKFNLNHHLQTITWMKTCIHLLISIWNTETIM